MASIDPDGPRCPECFEPIEPERASRVALVREHPGVHVVCPNCAEPLVIAGEIGEPVAERPERPARPGRGERANGNGGPDRPPPTAR